MMNDQVGVLFISCDRYSYLWDLSARMLALTWPDCPYQKYLLSNNMKFSHPSIMNIQVGDDRSWSSGLRQALLQLAMRHEYVFTMLEDYYFDERIDSDFCHDLFMSFIQRRGDFLSLFPLPSKISGGDRYLGKLENHIPYRQSCVFTLWRIETLLDILRDSENAWEFEKVGVVRGFKYPGFYQSRWCPRAINLMVKGKIVPSEFARLLKWVPDATIDGGFMTTKDELSLKVRDSFIHLFLNHCPSDLKRLIYFRKLHFTS